MNLKPIEVVQAFIAAINKGDIPGLADLMTEDHTFIDTSGRIQSGRDEMTEAWQAYFRTFPDYNVSVEDIFQDHSTVAVFGSTTATYDGNRGLVPENRVGGPAAWKATVERGKQWQVVYCATSSSL